MDVTDQNRTFIPNYQPYIKRHNYPKIRCSFWLLAWANGCHYDCTYCWLKAGYHPWPWSEIHIAQKSLLAKVLRRFCARTPGSQLLNAGELCDPFIMPEYVSFMASTLRQVNREYGRQHRLLLLTKSADSNVLLQDNFQDVIVHSASVNAETPAKNLETSAPPPKERLKAAKAAREAGYQVRIRIDPIIIGYSDEYLGLMEHVCSNVKPSLITLGTLRATPRTHRFLPKTIKAQLTEKTTWGYGYTFKNRLSFYNQLVTAAMDHGVPVALYTEAPEVWKKLDLKGSRNCMPMGA